MFTHRARLSPLQAETRWTLQDGVLTENRGRRQRRFALTALKRLDVIARPRRAVRMLFTPLSAVVIPADSMAGPLRRESRAETFEPLLAALLTQGALAAPKARLAPVAPGPAAVVVTLAGILAFVAVAVAGLAMPLHLPAMGLELGSRMLFVALLLLAIHPWVERKPAPAAAPAPNDETFI